MIYTKLVANTSLGLRWVRKKTSKEHQKDLAPLVVVLCHLQKNSNLRSGERVSESE